MALRTSQRDELLPSGQTSPPLGADNAPSTSTFSLQRTPPIFSLLKTTRSPVTQCDRGSSKVREEGFEPPTAGV